MSEKKITAKQKFKNKFNIHHPLEFIRSVLFEFYDYEVACRGKDMIKDEFVETNINYVANWMLNSEKVNIIFYGDCGNGKTTLAKALCETLNYFKSEKECKVIRITAEDVILCAKGKLEHKDKHYENLKRYEKLFIDDLGTETIEVKDYGTSTLPMVVLLEERYANDLCTIITTNDNLDTLKLKYGDRIRDRFNTFAKIPFTHESYRK